MVSQQRFMHRHRRSFRPYGLRFHPQQQDLPRPEDLRSLQSDLSGSFQQDPWDPTGFFQNCFGCLSRKCSLAANHQRPAYKVLQGHFVYGVPLPEKVEGHIHMRAVMGAH